MAAEKFREFSVALQYTNKNLLEQVTRALATLRVVLVVVN
jgi:hypothetical protein